MNKKKGKIVTLFIGILVGAIITITGLIIYSNITANKNSEMMNNRPKPMSNDSQMLSGNGIPNNGQMPNDKTNQQIKLIVKEDNYGLLIIFFYGIKEK